MQVLVTGGAGYVGCVLVPLLLEAGHSVRVLDNLHRGGSGLLPVLDRPQLELVRGDVRSAAALREATRGVDAIVHLAAIVGYPACDADPALAEAVNLDGTVNLVRARSAEQPILFASTLSGYGAVAGRTCTEESLPRPVSLYGRTKLLAERRLVDAGNVVVYRPATAFGLSPRMRLDLLCNDFVLRAVRDGAILLYEPHATRSFLHVRDFARALLHALENIDRMRDRVYNLGDETMNLTKEALAARIGEHVGCAVHLSREGSDPDARDYFVSFARLRETGFRATLSLDDGIRELIRGYEALDERKPFLYYTNL